MSGDFAEQRNFQWYCNNTLVGSTSTAPYATEAYYTYTGLQANTWYNLDVKIYNTQGSLLTSFSTTGQTQPSPAPDPWVWTTAEMNAFQNKGLVSTITWQRYNAFLSKIDEFRTYKGWATLSSAAYLTATDRVLTATRFNLMRTAVGEMSSTGITDKATGDIVYGSYFITITNALNSIT